MQSSETLTALDEKKAGDQSGLVPKAIPFQPGETLDLSVELQVPVEILRN